MNKRLRALLKRREAAIQEARAIAGELDVAEGALGDIAEGEPTEEAQAKIDGLRAKSEAAVGTLRQFNDDIDTEEQLVAAEKQLTAAPANDSVVQVGEDRAIRDPRAGFAHFAAFAMAVVQATIPGGALDERLILQAAAPSTFSGEAVGIDGGFLVPPEFAQEIFTLALEEDSLLPLTNQIPVSGNSMTFPKDETTPWGSTGVQIGWEDEVVATTPTKLLLGETSLKLKKLTALVPVGDELLADAPAVAQHLINVISMGVRWKVNNAIVNGNGAGQPEGFLNAAALASQAKESGQTASTINATNVGKMYGRLLVFNRANARWLIHPDAYHQLFVMTVGNAPIWTPPSTGLTQAPGGLLMGIGIIISNTCQTLGTKGDIYLVDLTGYRTITKATGLEIATSMHLYFDANATAFRAVFRMDGKSAIAAAVSPPQGSTTISPFISLDTRA